MQDTTVIAKTTQTAVGAIIGTENAMFLTLFATYVKGDETGLDIIVKFQRAADSTAMQDSEWTDTAGVLTYVARKYKLTASVNVPIRVDVSGIDYVLVTQGGTTNDGTPTGTLAMSYTLSEG
jgi:hypothetical protein